ncbi:MAG: YqaJ viral recombinase family protein [Gammaproteobacteria bacterium]
MIKQIETPEEWVRERKLGIGSSDAPAILGESNWDSPYSLWARKTGTDVPSKEESEAMRWGHLLEDPIALEVGERTGFEVVDPGDYTVHMMEEWPIARATLDRVVFKDPHDAHSEGGVLEIKTANSMTLKDWYDSPPLYPMIQLQHQMMVTDLTWGILAVLVGGQTLLYDEYPRDDEFCKRLLAREQEFWQHVQDGTAPTDIDGSAATREALRQLHPEDNGETVALPEEAIFKHEQLLATKAQIKALEDDKETLANWFRQKIGAATFGEVGDVRYSFKSSTTKDYFKVPIEQRPLLTNAGIDFETKGGSTSRSLLHKKPKK